MEFSGPDHPSRKLAAALELVNSEDLRDLITRLPDPPETLPTRKADRVAVLLAHLSGEPLKRIWEGLTKIEKTLVSEIVHETDGRLNKRKIRARYGPEALASIKDSRSRGCLKGRVGLLVYAAERNHLPTVIPGDLRFRLSALAPRPAKESMETASNLPGSIRRNAAPGWKEPRMVDIPLMRRDMEVAAQHDLIAVLRLVGNQGVTVSPKTAQATAASVRGIAAVMNGAIFSI